MSEYQYYGFRAIDRPLNADEMKMLRALSKRGKITATSFVNTYNWGDFKGDPDALMETCFDAFVYLANWGTRRLVFRLPKSLVSSQSLSCCQGDGLAAHEAGEFVVIDFNAQNESGEWDEYGYEDDGYDSDEDPEEDAGWMARLIGLREELVRGDDRCLYLGWLHCLQSEELDEDDIEPPVPRGLQSLSPSLAALVDFLDLDPDLLEVAASVSEEPLTPPTREELAAFVQTLATEEKDALLVDTASGAGLRAGAEILRRFERSRAVSPDSDLPRVARTVGELLATAEELTERNLRLSQEKEAEQKARKEREAARERQFRLDQVEEHRDLAWKHVHEWIQTKLGAKYDLAVQLLVDLRDVAVRGNRAEKFQAELQSLCQLHANKPALLRRISNAGL